jgi:hypothetical protein
MAARAEQLKAIPHAVLHLSRERRQAHAQRRRLPHVAAKREAGCSGSVIVEQRGSNVCTRRERG